MMIFRTGFVLNKDLDLFLNFDKKRHFFLIELIRSRGKVERKFEFILNLFNLLEIIIYRSGVCFLN